MSDMIVLMGIPGSGKSTWASESDYYRYIISPDSIRETLGDINDQSRNDEVFRIAHERVNNHLQRGLHVVFDATSVTERARRDLLRIADSIPGTFKRLVVFDPGPVAFERNSQRDRVVPDHVMHRMVTNFSRSLGQIGYEPWDFIEFVRD